MRELGTAIKFCLGQNYGDKQEKFTAFKKKDIDIAGFTNSQCYLIGEYGHHVIGIERHFDIEGHLRNFIASQTVLYSLKSSYRDHLFHMIDVCFLGFFLLNCKIGDKTLLTIFKENGLDNKPILKNWFVASLFHDIGYILNLHKYIHGETAYIISPEINEFKNIINNAVEVAIHGNTKEGAENCKGFCENAIAKLMGIGVNIKTQIKELPHGIVSALHVCNLIDKIQSQKDRNAKEDYFEYYLPAISAIVKHDLDKEEIDLKKEPIGFLLSLCDEIQEWERPSLEMLPFKERIATAIRFGTSLDIVIPRTGTNCGFKKTKIKRFGNI